MLSNKLRNNVLTEAFSDSSSYRTLTCNRAQIMKEFPEELRGDMALHLYRELLATPLFEAASQGCLKKLAYQCVRYRFSTPGEYLLHRGDRIGSLYFICSGSLEILRNGLVVAILGSLRVLRSALLPPCFGAALSELSGRSAIASRGGTRCRQTQR